jgi:ACR3 family arsenite efflux pump ArsB
MQSTPPLGGAIAGLLLARGTSTAATATAMGLVMAVPGLLGLVSPALADEHTWPRELSPDPR